jgi:hypothetical protein
MQLDAGALAKNIEESRLRPLLRVSLVSLHYRRLRHGIGSNFRDRFRHSILALRTCLRCEHRTCEVQRSLLPRRLGSLSAPGPAAAWLLPFSSGAIVSGARAAWPRGLRAMTIAPEGPISRGPGPGAWAAGGRGPLSGPNLGGPGGVPAPVAAPPFGGSGLGFVSRSMQSRPSRGRVRGKPASELTKTSAQS